MLGVSTLKYEYTPDGKKKKNLLWRVYEKDERILVLILNTSHLSMLNFMQLHASCSREGLRIRWRFDCEIDYRVICKQAGFGLSGFREVINIDKKQTVAYLGYGK